MQKFLLRSLVFLPALYLTACESVDGLNKDDAAATAQEQGISPAEMAAMDAQSRGLGEGGDLRGRALGDPGSLDNPNSPLATRIIYFDYDSDVIMDQYHSAVEAHAAYLTKHPGTVMTLDGHTDERGSREYNLALGERRALAVRRQISALGANGNQVRTVSYGEERPASTGHDESAYGKNRRVEINY
jgi:peptidoglycan-associated lipoprotein